MLCSKCQESAEGLTDAGLCPDCHLESEGGQPGKRDLDLPEILKRITPLPWGKLPVVATVLVNRETVAGETYALHAANVLPELVAAARNVQENWEHNLTEPLARLHKALVAAEKVKGSS